MLLRIWQPRCNGCTLDIWSDNSHRA